MILKITTSTNIHDVEYPIKNHEACKELEKIWLIMWKKLFNKNWPTNGTGDSNSKSTLKQLLKPYSIHSKKYRKA